MAGTGLSRVEQETIINFNAAEDTANLYSADPVWMRKIEKLGGSKFGIGMEVTIPKKWIRIQKPNTMTPEAKAKAVERLSKSRFKPKTALCRGIKKSSGLKDV